MKGIVLVAGARPNFMKIAPLYRRLARSADVPVRIVHTGQHYDRAMSDVFFEQLGLPEPGVTLNVGSGPHGAQTGRVLERFEAALAEHQPDAVVVVGDVNSTLACALAAVKIQYPDGSRPLVAHVEAGLRSGDRSMPEEINRVLTDAIADVLFTSEPCARANLLREGVSGDRIHFAGNVMIDCLVDMWPAIEARRTWRTLGLERDGYALVTLHRPSNVDAVDTLAPLIAALERIAAKIPIVFPVHPRTRARLKDAGLNRGSGILVVDPLPYVEFISVLSGARLVMTDSGGLQEESTYLRIPCLTLRDNTERPVTITHGTNRLVGRRPVDLPGAAFAALQTARSDSPWPPLWDGRASDRIAAILWTMLEERKHDGRLSGVRVGSA